MLNDSQGLVLLLMLFSYLDYCSYPDFDYFDDSPFIFVVVTTYCFLSSIPFLVIFISLKRISAISLILKVARGIF